MQDFFKQHKKSIIYGLGACVLGLVVYGYSNTPELAKGSKDSATNPISLKKVDNTYASINEVLNTQQELANLAEQDTFYHAIAPAEDLTSSFYNQYREDVLDESFYSMFLQLFAFDFKIDSKSKAVLDVCFSKLPTGPSPE